MGAATPFVVGAIGLAQYQQQGAIGRYNQDVANRNALVAEQEAQLIEKQSEFDIARFDTNFKKLKSSLNLIVVVLSPVMSSSVVDS